MVAKLQVQLLQARDLAPKDSHGFSDPVARLVLNKTKAKSATVYKDLNPTWNEEFLFAVDDVDKDVLEISLWDEGFFGAIADCLGHLKIPVADVASADGQNLPPTWFPLQPDARRPRSSVSGELQLAFALYGFPPRQAAQSPAPSAPLPDKSGSPLRDPGDKSSTPHTKLSRNESLLADSPEGPAPASEAESPENPDYPDEVPIGRSESSSSATRLAAGADEASERSNDEEASSLGTPPPPGGLKGFRPGATLQSIASSKLLTSLKAGPKAGASKGDVTMQSLLSSDVSSHLQRIATRTSKKSAAVMSNFVKTTSTSIQNFQNIALRSATPSSSELNSQGGVGGSGVMQGRRSPGAPGDELPSSWFDKDLKDVKASSADLPPPYEGGVVLDQNFTCSAQELNRILFGPGSEFYQEFCTARKASQVEVGPWIQGGGEGADQIHRTVTYMTAPSALVKSVKATEEMVYSRADAGGYVVESTAATPDVPYGTTFRAQVQFCIAPVQDGGSHLRVSWHAQFLQSTMMKSMIENGMRSGIKDTYVIFLQVLTRHATPAGLPLGTKKSESLRKKTLLEKSAGYVLPALFAWFLVDLLLLIVHFIKLRASGGAKGLNVWPLNLPDTLSEILTTAMIVLVAERVALRTRLLITSRLFRKGDAGKKASGEGWIVVVTLVEGENIGGTGIRDLADPYVVFICNGKTRTSSVKLQTAMPKWGEVLEFDASDDVPSMMEVEVFDFEGPFAEPDPLGRAEVNLLKLSKEDTTDLWVPLQGRRARLYESRVHLRVLLTQTAQGSVPVPKIVEKISKVTGRKPYLPSAEKSKAFRDLFELPEHEFLVNDFACALKKTIHIQGRLFLSPRIIGFYSNLFGKKLKFLLQWEDVDEIEENSGSINQMHRLMNPSITLHIKRGKGNADVHAGSLGVDPEGRLKIRFQSFVRPSVAFRTIQLLWKHRSLSPEQQLQIVQEAEEQDELLASTLSAPAESTEPTAFVGWDPPEVLYTMDREVPLTVETFVQMIQEMNILQKIAEAMGQLNLEASEWVDEPDGMGRVRNLRFTLTRQQSSFGTKVAVTQRTAKDPTGNMAWAQLDEVIRYLDVPLGDHFQVEMKRHIQLRSQSPPQSDLKLTVMITWQKETDPSTKEKIKTDISGYYKKQTDIVASLIVEDIIAATH